MPRSLHCCDLVKTDDAWRSAETMFHTLRSHGFKYVVRFDISNPLMFEFLKNYTSFNENLERWAEENLSNNWTSVLIEDLIYFFEDANDALKFKLTWVSNA